MADEFQAGVCGGNWWNNNPTRSAYGSSLCSPAITDFGWPADLRDMKARSGDESGSANNSEGSIVFQDIQKPINQDSGCGDRSSWMDSTLEMMGSGLSSSITTDWNQTLIHGSKGNESNYQSILQEDLNSTSSNYHQDVTIDYSQIKKDWSLKNFSTIGEDSSTNTFKPANQDFPVTAYGYPTSPSLQTLFDTNSQPQDSIIFGNRSMDYPSTTNDCSAKFSLSPKFSSLLKPSLPKEEPLSHLNLSNNATFWNSSAAAMNDVRASFFSPVQSQIILSTTFEDKSSFPNQLITAKSNNERVRDLSSVVKKSNSTEPTFKRPRIETPSPLPTFKVRKEKLGDRITALQQLVSPFGKTDTASVLHEAIEYIKLLHDQVSVLSTPYMKSGSPIQCEQTLKKSEGAELGVNQDLRRRGLCLVPISSTFPVATETTADFWTPTFGATLR